MRRQIMITLVVAAIGAASVATQGQGSLGPLPQFNGDYQIVRGPSGGVRVAGAMGGAYTEWTVSVGQPSHAVRMLVAAPGADGRFRVWRFEQDPAPGVEHEGRRASPITRNSLLSSQALREPTECCGNVGGSQGMGA